LSQGFRIGGEPFPERMHGRLPWSAQQLFSVDDVEAEKVTVLVEVDDPRLVLVVSQTLGPSHAASRFLTCSACSRLTRGRMIGSLSPTASK
jgi:hypothetical protein